MKKYILTTDNKIIDTEKYDIYKITDKAMVYEYVVFAEKGDPFNIRQVNEPRFTHIIETYKIRKESDYIIELINKEKDLIKIKDGNVENIIEAKSVNGELKNMKETIIAIYKPNENKGYDLAWESE